MHKLKPNLKGVKAFAPATCANVAVGFDILGFALDTIGDYVTLVKRDDKKILIESISSIDSLPLASHKNTASVVVEKLCRALNLATGFSIHIAKGIPLSSGMGGSAASAVAALVALNCFLSTPLSLHELAIYALEGEKTASGEAHYDNILPCLFGGLTLTCSQNPLEVLKLPIPKILCVLVHPHLKVRTSEARQLLKTELGLKDHVQQSMKLASFIASLYEKDYSKLRKSLDDLIIEPQRAKLIPGFYEVKQAALKAGALGMSFSGSGPALFAFATTKEIAKQIAKAMQQRLQKEGVNSDYWIAPINPKAAHVVEEQVYVY